MQKSTDEISQVNDASELLKLENLYLKSLLEECRSKNNILMENNRLLNEIIQSTKVPTKTSTHEIKSSNIKKDKKLATSGDKSSSNVANIENTRLLTVPSYVPVDIGIPKHISTSEKTKINKQTENKECPVNEWTTVERRKVNKNPKSTKKPCYGTKTTDENMTIRGAIRRQWIYVGKIAGKHVTEEDVKKFLKESKINEQVSVKKLNCLGPNSAFSVGLPTKESYETVFKESFWPQGVALREFSFDKKFFQKNREARIITQSETS